MINRKIPNYIPQREIGPEEEELLDQLWEQIPDAPADETRTESAFRELQRRIRRKQRIRRAKFVAAIGGMAAMIALCFLPWKQNSEPVGAIAQLRQIGVTVDDNEVKLSCGNTLVLSLDSAASIRQNDSSKVNLHTASGKQIELADKSLLKLEVPAGKHFQLTLADGTQVWLNASSTLEYPASFEGLGERRVKLTGEAFFDVAHNEQVPFFVETGEESIRVLGTSFNVNAYPDNEKHVTTLLTGKISYRHHRQEQPLTLLPDQQVCMTCQTGETQLREVDASTFCAWKEGWICFEDERITELAQRLARIYGITIVVDEKIKWYAFSGKISYERGADYITRLITETTPIRCEIENGVIYLK